MEFDIRFSGRAHCYTEEEVDLVSRVMQEADPLTQGRYLAEFEARLRAHLGANHVFAVHTATSALELAAQLSQFDQGDEVIIPSHTFTATAYPFVKQGCRVVWADIDPRTRVVTVDTLERCITDKTRAIVVVHLYGYGADMPGIMQLAQSYDLLVIEDVAQALDVEVAGQKVGTFGDYGAYSFHSHKNVTTLGEGGALVVRSEQDAELVPMLRHNGHCAFDFPREDYWIPAMGNVDLPEKNGRSLFPNNFCLGEVECALGARLLERSPKMNAEKRARALQMIDELSDYPELQFHREDSTRHSYHLLAACFADVDRRNEFIRRMAQEERIQCVVQYYPLNRYDFYRKLGLGDADCPNADRFFDTMVSLPFHHGLSELELERIVAASRRTIERMGQ